MMDYFPVFIMVCSRDDQAMTANTEKGLEKFLDETNKVVKKYGMKINIKRQKL